MMILANNRLVTVMLLAVFFALLYCHTPPPHLCLGKTSILSDVASDARSILPFLLVGVVVGWMVWAPSNNSAVSAPPALREDFEVPPAMLHREQNYALSSQYTSPDIIVAPCDSTITIPPDSPNPSIISKAQTRQMIYPNPDNCGFQPVGPEYATRNQKLAGRQNPKTLNTPIIPNRLFDTDVWSSDSFFVPSGINSQRSQEYILNGYLETSGHCEADTRTHGLIPGACASSSGDPSGGRAATKEAFQRFDSHADDSRRTRACAGRAVTPVHQLPGSNFCYPHPTASVPVADRIQESMLNAPYGYFPENQAQQVPVNFPPKQQGLCNSTRYNAEQNTTLLQPGLVAYSNVNVTDAMNSNLGISFTQPHLPTELVDIPGTDAQAFVEMDPVSFARTVRDGSVKASHSPYRDVSVLPTSSQVEHYQHKGGPQVTGTLDPRTIYDPRLTGYGTSYRHYIDEMTGQPRFFYDDVNAHRQYNYLTKTKVDFIPELASSGAYQPQHLSNAEVRNLAESAFHNNTIQQRTELQDRLMQKVIHRNRQRKQAPIRVHN